MSKPVKNLITDQYKTIFEGVSGAVVVDIRGIPSNTTNEMRSGLADKDIKVTVVKNSLAKRAFAGHDLEPIGEVLDGACTMVYPTSETASAVVVARELIDWAKKVKELQFRGAVLDGIVFGPDEIQKLSEYPTKEEAQAKVVQILLTPAQNLVGAVTAPGKNIAGILKTIQDKLEAGESLAKAS
jgi:large subunit ribosomal protein L10